jgi:hypothetical protein
MAHCQTFAKSLQRCNDVAVACPCIVKECRLVDRKSERMKELLLAATAGFDQRGGCGVCDRLLCL